MLATTEIDSLSLIFITMSSSVTAEDRSMVADWPARSVTLIEPWPTPCPPRSELRVCERAIAASPNSKVMEVTPSGVASRLAKPRERTWLVDERRLTLNA
jgi:hypothetical protein